MSQDVANAGERTESFADLVARVCRVTPETVTNAERLSDASVQHQQRRSAGEWRIEQYIPARHQEAVLEICPSPVKPTAALPLGQCRCVGGRRHFVPQNESQQLAFATARRYVDGMLRGRGPALVLVGPTGVGKSHLLWGACRALNERGVNAAGVSWKRLSDTIRDAKSSPDQEYRQRAVYERDRYTHSASLHLDEVRATAGTDFDPMELSLLATERYDHQQGLFMTSQQRGQALTALTDSAATGRLVIQEMVGENYRKPNDSPAG